MTEEINVKVLYTGGKFFADIITGVVTQPAELVTIALDDIRMQVIKKYGICNGFYLIKGNLIGAGVLTSFAVSDVISMSVPYYES